MKAKVLISLVLVASLGLSCVPETGSRISVSDSLEISVTEVDGGIQIENLSGAACIVSVRSPEGEQEFELAAGESVTISGASCLGCCPFVLGVREAGEAVRVRGCVWA